jgi:hypothetical protein
MLSRLLLPPTYLPLLHKTITTARPQVKILYITVSFRPGHPEIVLSNATFSAVQKANNLFVAGSWERRLAMTGWVDEEI